MHSFDAPSGRSYFHNSDFDGDITFLGDSNSVTERPFDIPFEDIRALYLEYLRRSKISALEQASYDFLEGEARRGL